MLAVLLFGSWTIRGNRREDKGRTVGQRIGRVEGSRMEGREWRGENGGKQNTEEQSGWEQRGLVSLKTFDFS